MKVFFIGAGPGDPDLLTLKAAQVIKEANIIIYAGSLVPPEIISSRAPQSAVHDSCKMDLDEVLSIYENNLSSDVVIARIHSGDPSLYGAIQEQIEWLEERDVDIEIIPGISAFQAGAARLQQELTMPGGAQTIILTRAPGRTPKPEDESLDRLASTGATLCIYLSIDRIEAVSSSLLKVLPPHTPAVVIQYISRANEKVVHGDLASISGLVKAAGIDRTALIYVGSALSRKPPSKSLLYDAEFSHMYRTSEGSSNEKGFLEDE